MCDDQNIPWCRLISALRLHVVAMYLLDVVDDLVRPVAHLLCTFAVCAAFRPLFARIVSAKCVVRNCVVTYDVPLLLSSGRSLRVDVFRKRALEVAIRPLAHSFVGDLVRRTLAFRHARKQQVVSVLCSSPRAHKYVRQRSWIEYLCSNM